MRLAWFRPEPSGPPSSHLDDVVDALSRDHAITLVPEARAHDFVWQHARGHFDVVVYELDNTARHVYMWPYLLHYPGVVALQTASLHDSRRARLVHEGRLDDYRNEIAFAGGPAHTTPPWHLARGRWPMLRIPVAASRLTVVADELLAETLAAQDRASRVRAVVVGVADPAVASGASAVADICIAEPQRRGVVERAVARLHAEGTPVSVASNPRAPIVVATRWPLDGRPLVSAFRAFAESCAVVVADSYATAGWPTLDPQTWQVRGTESRHPIAVSIDPRDEEHSLVLALRRLATDAALCEELGRSARAWWQTHATLEHAVTSWNAALRQGAEHSPPNRPADWPAHLGADGSSLTRQQLDAFGLDLPWR
jgi:hypothetical protein